MATKRRRDDSSSSSSETSSSSSSSETSSSSSSSSSSRRRRRRNKKSRTTTTRKEKRRKREERDGDDDVEGLETNAKLLDARKKLLKKIRDFERAHERAKDIITSRAQEKKTKKKSRSGSHHHHHHHHHGEEEENARPHQREYDGPMDRERAAMMMPATNEWTREKEERAREKVEKKVFAPPPAPKRRKVGENAKDEDAEEGEVKKEQKKFVPPPGEMTMKAAPYVPPPKQKAAKTWKRPPVVPNRNKVEGPKIPEIGKSGFTRQRSVSPGIHAKDLAPWTMSAHAKKPTTEEEEEEEEEEEAVKEKPKNVPPAAPARTRATRSASPSPMLPKPIPPAPESRRRSSRRSKSVSVEPDDPSTLGEKKEQRPPTRQKAAAAAAAASAALTVRELKDILAKKGLRTDGLKADLVERVASLEEKN